MTAPWQRSWLKSKDNPLIFVRDVLGATVRTTTNSSLLDPGSVRQRDLPPRPPATDPEALQCLQGPTVGWCDEYWASLVVARVQLIARSGVSLRCLSDTLSDFPLYKKWPRSKPLSTTVALCGQEDTVSQQDL